MILIQRYIFKEILYNFAFTFVVISMIMLLAMSVRVIFKFPMFGFLMLVKNIPLMLVAVLKYIVPAAVLVATVMTYGRIASDNEIVTMRASGIHILRIVVPGVLFGLVASLALLVINDRLVPVAERQIKALESEVDISSLLDNILMRGRKELELGDKLLTWESCTKISEDGKAREWENPVEAWRFSGLRVKLFDEEGNITKEILAESATVMVEKGGRKLVFCLYKGKILPDEGDFEKFNLPIELSSGRRSKIRLNMRGFAALSAIKGRKDKAYPDYLVETELHKRIADSFGPLLFVFLSLPIAILFRQQNRMVAFLIAILIAFFVYFPITLLGETVAKKGMFPPVFSIWPGTVFLSLLGIWLVVRVMRR